MKKALLGFALTILLATQMWAINAYPELVRFRQPNTEIFINIYLKGDEHVHWAETEDGYSLLHAKDGSFVYAIRDNKGGMIPSDILATNKESRTPEVEDFLSRVPRHLHYSQAQVDQMLSLWQAVEKATPQGAKQYPIGDRRVLVVLFEFQDQHFTHSRREFENLFNQINYSDHNASGSVHDYYHDVSYGQFNLMIDVVGPICGVDSTYLYGSEDGGYQKFAEEVVDSADKYINFADYDNDGDGYIDGMHIIFAGHGEEATGNSSLIWSHKWNIFSNPERDGVVVNLYSCSPECGGNMGNELTNIGVICHELGHVFGAPDYYDTDYAGSGGTFPGLGNWDIMSSGSWNGGGRIPAHHNPYTKIYIYGWATCDTLDNPQMVTMDAVANSKYDYHRVNTSTEGDFFLIENRQKIKWDDGIPGTGMIVYHIHPSAHDNSVSNFRHPQQIYILSPSDVQFPNSNPSSYGDLNSEHTPYPGLRQRTTLDDDTYPWFRPWSGEANNSPITYISENTTYKTVSFCFKGAEPMSHDLTAEGVSDTKARLSWVNYGNLTSMIIVSTENTFGTPTRNYALGDTVEGGGIVMYLGHATASTVINNLQPNQTYYFRHYNKLSDSTYTTTCLSASATTRSCGSAQWDFEGFEDTSAHAECWVGDWTTATESVSSGEHSLMAVSDGVNIQSVVSAPFEITRSRNTVVSFDANFQNSGADDTLRIRYRSGVDAEWKEVGTFATSTLSEGWNRLYFFIDKFSDYSLLQFDFISTTAGSKAFIDDLSFQNGYLLSTLCSEGGTVTHLGYEVHQTNDTVDFEIQREPGYKFANMYIDGEIKTNLVRNNQYSHRIKTNVNIKFTFVKTNEIQSQDERPALKAFPNPASDRITLEGLNPQFPVLLLDLYGRTLSRWQPDQETLSLDLSTLPHGIYLLRNDSQTLKVIKR